MKITYDESTDSMYIKFNENLDYKTSKKVSEDIVLDYSNDGKVIGVEVLSVSDNAILPLPIGEGSIPIELSSKPA